MTDELWLAKRSTGQHIDWNCLNMSSTVLKTEWRYRCETHLSVSSTGDDLTFVRVVADGSEQRVGDNHLKSHKAPRRAGAEETGNL